ncbi:MAG: helix-turn-helix domain-containing protein [Candidatus Nitrosocaldus sp.]
MQEEAYAIDERQQALDKILNALADKYNRLILTSTIDEPKSALQISKEHGIPASTVYRKLHVLKKDGLIKVDGSVIDNGKRYYLYRSNIKAINIIFTMNTLKVDVTLNKDMRRSAYW